MSKSFSVRAQRYFIVTAACIVAPGCGIQMGLSQLFIIVKIDCIHREKHRTFCWETGEYASVGPVLKEGSRCGFLVSERGPKDAAKQPLFVSLRKQNPQPHRLLTTRDAAAD